MKSHQPSSPKPYSGLHFKGLAHDCCHVKELRSLHQVLRSEENLIDLSYK